MRAGWVTEGVSAFDELSGSPPVSIRQQALRGLAKIALERSDRIAAKVWLAARVFPGLSRSRWRQRWSCMCLDRCTHTRSCRALLTLQPLHAPLPMFRDGGLQVL